MGCFDCDPEERKNVQTIVPYKDRSCTDILGLLLFVGMWVATIVVCITAIANGGNPNRIIRSVDYNGDICGENEVVQNLPVGGWPDPLDPSMYKFQVCLSSCAQTATDSRFVTSHTSTEFIYYCMPTTQVSGGVSITLTGDFQSASESFSRAMGDVFTAWVMLLVAAILGVVLSFGWLGFLKMCAACLVWTLCLIMTIAGAILTYSLLQEASDIDESVSDDNRKQILQGLGFASLAITVVFVLLIIGMRNRIKLAIAIVKVASSAVNDMRSLVFFPVFPILFLCGYLVFWIVDALYIYSIANKTATPTSSALQAKGFGATFFVWERDESWNNTLAFHFFTLLWNIQFVVYFGYLVTAGAIADWYFSAKENGSAVRAPKAGQVAPVGGTANAWTDDEANKSSQALSASPVWDSVKRTTRFHLGTIAVASLIIAIINFIRACVKYLEEHSQNKESRIQRCIFCCIQCCLKCLHCCADKISKNGLVWTAVFGDSFCTASCSSFSILWNNLARVAAINVVGPYLIVLGNFVVAVMSAGICALVMMNVTKYKDELSSIAMPTVMCFIIAYAVCSLFMIVFETTIDTIFLCFLIDESANKGGVMRAPKQLADLVGEHSAESEKLAKSQKESRPDDAE